MDRVVAQELSVHGSHGMPARQYADLLDLVAGGRLDPRLLVGRVVGLDEAGAALEAMSRPAETVGMTVVRVRG
jgi:threonine dehydrogenase-like Zn-dependent dehydrogenase